MIARQSPFAAIGRRDQPAPLCGGSLTATPPFPLLPSVEITLVSSVMVAVRKDYFAKRTHLAKSLNFY
jgi:hypothetical protein